MWKERNIALGMVITGIIVSILGGCVIGNMNRAPNENHSSTVSSKELERSLLLPSAIQEWHEIEEKRIAFSPMQLFDIIDGGAERYIDRGLVKGVYQTFAYQNGGNGEVFIKLFSSEDSVKIIFDEETDGIDTIPISSDLLPLAAVGESYIGGATVFGYISDIYFTISLNGFQEEGSMISAVRPILSVLKKRGRNKN